MPPHERRPAEVLSTSKLAPGVVGLKIRASSAFTWIPGQHLEVGLAEADEKAAYSIASAPHPDSPGVFEMAASDRNNQFVGSVEPGQQLWISEPRGNFVRSPMPGSALFIAVGTGVAPLRAMLQSEFQSEGRHPMLDRLVLLFGCRSEPDILFREEFEALARKHPRFEFIPSLTDASPNWLGARGRVQTHLAKILHSTSAPQAFICGTSEMARSTSDELRRLGLSVDNIHSQGYG
ncbi:MAG: hypothetical protein SFV15_08845 [Polyangiaceae bacterium]|nr:hypothetical protein [Polyangiaceae bacterium]